MSNVSITNSGKYRTLTEQVIHYLTQKNGGKSDRGAMAKQFDIDTAVLKVKLNEMVEAGQIKTLVVSESRLYYIPTAEQAAKHEALLATLPQPRVFRQYVMPPEMMLQMARCKEARSAVNSFFGDQA